MNIIKRIKEFFRKEVNYMYFKKIESNYYGLCGAKRTYLKTEKSRGHLSPLEDLAVMNYMKVRGWIRIEKSEFTRGAKDA